MTASAGQRPQAGAALTEANCRYAISRWRICNRAVASGLSSAPKSNKGEEAAKPGQPVAQSAFLEVSPRWLPRENRRLPLALPHSFGPARNFHVSLNTLSVSLLRTASQKPSPIVQKLWTMRVPCGRPRKS